MARAKKAEGEKRPTAYSKKFKEKVVTPEEAKEIMEKPIKESIEKSKEDLRKAFEDDEPIETTGPAVNPDQVIEDLIPEVTVPEVHSRASMYDAEVVGQLIMAAKKSMLEHGIVNVIELSRTYYIPIDDVRGILEEIGMM